ncbi:MAG: hypothetical protein ACKOA5_13420, partial [Actinomycetota bacterium]
DEIAASLELTFANAQKLVQRVRERIARSAGALLVARQGRKDCSDLNVLLVDWDGTFSPLWRKRIARHVDECSACERKRAVLLQPGGAVMAAPYFAAPESLRTRIFDSVAAGVDLGLSALPKPPLLLRPAVLSSVAGVAFVAILGVVANNGTQAPEFVESSSPAVTVDSTASADAAATVSSTVPPAPQTTMSATVPPAPQSTVSSTVPPAPKVTIAPTSRTTVPPTVPLVSETTALPEATTSTISPVASVAPAESPAVIATTTLAPAPVVESTVAPVVATTTTVTATTTTAKPVSNSPSKFGTPQCSGFGNTKLKAFTLKIPVSDPQGVASVRMRLTTATAWNAAVFESTVWRADVNKVDLAATKATVVIEATDKAGGVTTAQIAVYATTCP